MNGKFTRMAAAVALLVALCIPLGMWGQNPANGGGMTKTAGDEINRIANIVSGKTYYIKSWKVSNNVTTYQYLSFTDEVGDTQSGTGVSSTDDAIAVTFNYVSENTYTLKTANGHYIAPGTSNGKICVSENPINITVSNQTSNSNNFIRLAITSGNNTWAIQHNNQTDNFGGYKLTQRDIVLIEAATSTPICSVNPTSYDFGEMQAGSDALTKEFTVTASNLTSGLSFSISEGSDYYSIDKTGMSSTTPSETITVTLTPSAVGTMAGVLTIEGDDFDENIEVALTATGTCIAPTTALAFVSPINLPLSEADEYTLAPIENTGNGGDITYEVTTNPGENGMVENNQFTAVATGMYVVRATQALNGTICGGTFDITINVVGTDPTCTIDLDEFDFGTVAIGESAEKTFTVTTANLTGDVALAIDNEAFTVSPDVIQQGAASTEITITFTPTAAGLEVVYLTANGGGISNDELAYIGGTGAPVLTVTFDAGTGTCDTETMSGISGTEITLPTAEPSAACAEEGWTFAGWATDPVNETSDTPELLPVNYPITETTTLYAVYKWEEIDNVNTVFNVADYADAHEWESGKQYTTVSISPITFTATGGGNDGKYYSDGTWRFYKSSNGTVSISATDDNITAVSSDPTRTFTIENGSASFVSSSADTRFKSITVTTSNTTTTYNSNPSCLETVATPTFSPAAGSYTTVQSVEISCETEDATIYYTTDGTVPTTESTEYEGAIEVNETKTIKAIAVKEGMNNSAVATATYTIDFEDVATPTFDPASGATFYTEGLSVTITCATEDASIYYTLDGSAPTSESTLYEGAISLTETTTIKAVAMKEGMDNSAVATATYTYADPNGPGTRNNPYTVAQAREIIDGLNGSYSTEVYVSGIVYSKTYNNDNSITYWISDDGQGSTSSNDGLQVYKGLSFFGATFSGSSQGVYVGEQVVVKGIMSKYNSKYQFNKDSELVLWVENLEEGFRCSKAIPGYGNSVGGYHLIASIADVDPAEDEDMLEGAFDLYYFDESENKEWRNYKAATFNLEPGKGYLYANSENVVLTISGTASVNSVSLKKTEGAEFSGMNLVGNPLASKAYIEGPFYIMNNDGSELVVANRNYIFPMEGVFVSASEDNETLNFSADAPDSGNTDLVVNVNAGNKTVDRAVVSFGQGGMLPKFQLNQNSSKLFIPQGSKDYAVVRSNAEGEMPVSFKAENNGTYTISANAENMEMTYLHLIDNKTGADVDLLATPSYTFEAKTTDYASRFRLVFNANGSSTGSETDGSATFAYNNGSEWVISNMGEATLQVVDVMGRVLSSETVSGNATMNTDNLSAGIYMMRLINGENVKVQKIVVR